MSSSNEEPTSTAEGIQPEAECPMEDRSSLNVSEPSGQPEGSEDVTSAPVSNEGDDSSSVLETGEQQNDSSSQLAEERKDRKRKKDVMYSRNRRKREKEEAEQLRARCSKLAKRNEALKKEETRLLHLFVDATSKIDLLQDRKPPPKSSTNIETYPGATQSLGTNPGNPSLNLPTSPPAESNRLWLDTKAPAAAPSSSQGVSNLISSLLQQRSQQSVVPGPNDSGYNPVVTSLLLQLLQQQQQQQQSTSMTAHNVANSATQSSNTPLLGDIAAALSASQRLTGQVQTLFGGIASNTSVTPGQAPSPMLQGAIPPQLSDLVARVSAPAPSGYQNPALQSVLGILLSVQQYPTTGAAGPGLTAGHHAGSGLYGVVGADLAIPRSVSAGSQRADMDGNTIRVLLEMLSQSLQSSSQQQPNLPNPGSDT